MPLCPSRKILPAALCAILLWCAHVGADEPYGRYQFDEADREHWSFVSPRRPELPAVKNAAWIKSPIDAFVLARLEEEGIPPNPPADRRTLLRRVYLDLIGLLPTPAEQAAFLDDESPGALAKVVDQLLARPEYGERWGRHWLDVVRYAESNGYERDGAKPSAWRYRDYVIESFNADKPYDRFLIEQLAGDELPDANTETCIATTFLRLGPWDDEPADPLVDRYDQLDDVLGTTTAAFMALTLRCARCHDHKFESFTQRDYTRMLAVFEPLKRPQEGRTDLDRMVGTAAELAAYQAASKAIDDQMLALRSERDRAEWEFCKRLSTAGMLRPADSATTSGTANADPQALPPDALEALLTEPTTRNPQQLAAIKKARPRLKELLDKNGADNEKQTFAALDQRLEEADKSRPPPLTSAYVWFEEGPQGGASHVWKRGNPRESLGEVDAGFPAILVDAAPGPATATPHSTGRRTQLAKWLARSDHPLTARVMVNRVWQHHFADGLVGSENDFGVMGETPTHPELLDWLASEFVAHGWRLKPLHRLIVISNTYQMSSTPRADLVARDPADDLLWRYPPRRLEAEAIRDCVLQTAGSMNSERAGPSVYPTISPDVLAGQSKPGNGWGKSDTVQAARRSVYVFVKRTLLVPELEVLDFPDTNGACEQRVVSTVAPQALTWFNGAFIREQAGKFAERLVREAGEDDQARIDLAYRLAFARPVTEAEGATVKAFLVRQAEQIKSDAAGQPIDARRQALADFCLVLLNSNEFVYMR